MRRELDPARRDQSLVARMDAIHLARGTLVGGRFNPAADRRFNYARADRDYESAFREAGVGAIGDDTAGVARRITASTVREPLLAALADWSACASLRESPGVGPRGGAESRPGALARPRPRSRGVGRPHRARHDGPDRAGRRRSQCPSWSHWGSGCGTWAVMGPHFLARVQQAHPDDFWAALTLARALQEGADRKAAAAAYRRALELRGDSAAVYNNLGNMSTLNGPLGRGRRLLPEVPGDRPQLSPGPQ